MENILIEKAKNHIKNLQVLSDELRVQLALGKAEAKDLIKNERTNILKYIREQRVAFQKENQKVKDQRSSLLNYLQDLESLLSDIVPKNVTDFDVYKIQVLEKICALEAEISNNYPSFNKDVQVLLDEFKLKMDAFRVNLVLHDQTSSTSADQIREDFNIKLNEVSSLLSKREEKNTNLEYFAKDISESFTYLKRAINDLR